jgi:hypothetical protein
MAVRGSCAPDYGCKEHPKHVELTTKEIKTTAYIYLDLIKHIYYLYIYTLLP